MMSNFEELFNKYNPLNAVPGGSDLERKNAYWIELGIGRERDRIVALLEAWVADDDGDFNETLKHIKGERKEP